MTQVDEDQIEGTRAAQRRPARYHAPAPGVEAPGGFTRGRRRRARRTRWSVRLADAVARVLITGGGLGVVVMFAAIVGFLLSVAVPLFTSAKLTERVVEALPPPTAPAAPAVQAQAGPETSASGAGSATRSTTQPAVLPVALGLDENLVAAWMLDARGRFSAYRLAGAELIESRLIADTELTAVAERRGAVAVARADGTVQIGTVGFETSYAESVPDAAESLKPGQTAAVEGAVAENSRGRIRLTRPKIELSDPATVAEGAVSPVRLLDYLGGGDADVLVALLEDGRLFYSGVRKQKNMMTGEVKTRLLKHELPRSPAAPADQQPVAVLLGKNARGVYVVYPSGHLTRYDTSDPANTVIAEEEDLTPGTDAPVTSAAMLLGNVTLIVGDADGRVTGWFAAPFADAGPRERATTDGLHMVRAHELPEQSGHVVAIAASSRDRQFLTADAAGNVVLRHMTSEATQATLRPFDGGPVALVALSPKNDALAALSQDGRIAVFDVDNPHPDGSFTALFRPVHYEGRAAPEHFWQSSAGTDAAELKFGVVPLVFGTMKATVYAMVFAVPLAILAAIYSAEFMQPRVRTVVKPLVELMAGLPSVVLGFIAALVLAPFVEKVVPAVLLTFAAVPTGVMAFGFLWQLLPARLARGAPGWLPFALMAATVVAMVMLAFALGPVLERVLFYGDFSAWLNRRVGTGRLGATPGWILLLTPLTALGLVLAFNLRLRQRIPLFDGRLQSRRVLALADLVRFVVLGLAAVAIAAGMGALLGLAGFDLRDGIFGTYVQRNAMVVGLVMGFAIIPIIYTVSEDALSSVPNTLRSAALGAGATPWQTAVRVVLPVAASGIFSACMIGFGRAAGETMIVLMAAGNTPVMEWNIFSGLRTLSANIAVEMPEAAVGSTHYRVLYLSALVLFGIAFAVNTVAEIVRMRFRRRAFQL